MPEILPKISIITPVFNRKDYIEKTILSVIGQNYPNLEYIIIDGGSTDGTVEIIKKYQDKISFWLSEPDKGMYDAINKGFQKSTGEIMAWLNSDDLYHTGSLMCVGNIFKDIKDIDWIIGKPSMFNAEGLCVRMLDTQKWSNTRIYTGDFRWIQQENVFWRRCIWEKAGSEMNTSFSLAADFELWTRFFVFSPLYSVSTSFAGFRLHGQQLSVVQSKLYEDETMRIYNDKTPDNLRISVGRKLFNITRKIENSRNSFTMIFKLIIQLFLKKINKYPPEIYYDFKRNIWKI